jgi:hypothetical protein
MMSDGWMIELRSDLEQMGILPERKFNQAMKIVLKDGLLHWKASYMRKHFTSAAYGAYYEVYKRLKVKFRKHQDESGVETKEPLVLTGNLRNYMLNRGEQVSGTSKQAKMRLRYGRPLMSDAKKEQEIRILIAKSVKEGGKPLTYKEAESQLYRSWGYGRRNRAYFQEAISATNPKEIRELCEFHRDDYLEQAKKLGERKRVRITG